MLKPTTNRVSRARFELVAALYKQQLGAVIRECREQLGLTQKELADRANVEEPQTVSRWERGLNAPTDLEAVARALETTPDEMLRRLQPVGQKERRRMLPDGASQLDRIEDKLDELLSRLPAAKPGEVFERAGQRQAGRRQSPAAGQKRTQPRAKAS